MDTAISVFEWITEHEGFLSGLVAIAALVGIATAAARMLWIRARGGLRSNITRLWRVRVLAASGFLAVVAIAYTMLISQQNESNSQQASRIETESMGKDQQANIGSVAGGNNFNDRPAIAVLPFDNLSTDPEQAFFADGLAEDLITRLSTWRAFPVIARNSSFQYRGGNLNLQQVSVELGARYLVEGSVRRANDRIRITAQLIDASSGEHVWAQSYDRELTDVFAVQDEISATIAASLVDDLIRSEGDRARRGGTVNLEAWSLFQLGMQHANRYTLDGFTEARLFFSQALDRDPFFATALAQLALSTVMEAMLSNNDSHDDLLSFAFESARRAVELDTRDPAAHAALGGAYLATGDPQNGINSIPRAVDLNPSMPEAWI